MLHRCSCCSPFFTLCTAPHDGHKVCQQMGAALQIIPFVTLLLCEAETKLCGEIYEFNEQSTESRTCTSQLNLALNDKISIKKKTRTYTSLKCNTTFQKYFFYLLSLSSFVLLSFCPSSLIGGLISGLKGLIGGLTFLFLLYLKNGELFLFWRQTNLWPFF